MKAEMWNKNGWIEFSPVFSTDDDIKKIFDDALILSGFEIIRYVEHRFQPHGFTCLWLLGESHFAIHTFPEENQFYFEISSCVESYFNFFCKMIKKYEK